MTDFSPTITAIANDGVICYPTEGVWGLGCHPQSATAFARLLAIKQRPVDKGVILLAGELEQLSPYITINSAISKLFFDYQHNFVTFVLPKSANCPAYLSGQFDSIAVRVTHYAPLRELCLQAKTALVSTSANVSGSPPVDSIQVAQTTFANKVDAYVDMPLGGQAKPSKILRWHHGVLEVIRD